MNDDLKIIKKNYGENMSKLCRELFPTLLEKEGLLSKLMTENFNSTHLLYDDIIDNNLTIDFQDYIYSLVEPKNSKEQDVDKTPTELLNEAGYDLYECKTENDILDFSKYYIPEEKLCTFNGGRLEQCYVFFAVKKDVAQIKRGNFTKPKRQDEYGTSVLSIQFTKSEAHILSIKNRYNHTVKNPDATFGNCLDNIIPGLTKSFEKEYNLVQKYKNKNFEIPNYTLASDGKYYRYNYEYNNIYYCPDNIIIDSYDVKKYNKDKYIILDYFILDLEHLDFYFYDKLLVDSFLDDINDILKIEITNNKNYKNIEITIKNGKMISITIDRFNRIISYKNPNLTIVGHDFLNFNEVLETINCPNLQIVGDYFLNRNQKITKLNFPKLQYVGNNVLCFNKILESLYCPNLQAVGDAFLLFNKNLITLDLPRLQSVGDSFLQSNKSIEQINCPSLKSIGHRVLLFNENLVKIYLPNLKCVGIKFLDANKNINHNFYS